MRRMPVMLCALALALAFAACSDGGAASTPSAVPTATSTSSPSPPSSTSPVDSTSGPTGSPSPAPQPDVRLPPGMTPVVDDPADIVAISSGDLSPLVPSGSSVGRSAVLTTPDDPVDQVAVAWSSGELASRRSGLIVWQLAGDPAAWRAVYAFTDPEQRGVFGVGMEQADVTRDQIPDLLTFEDVGGSGACGIYRVIASRADDAAQILRRSVCDIQIQIAGGDLRIREAVFEPSDPHCCPSAFRTTVLRWNDSDWVEISSEVSAVPDAG